LRKDPKVQQEHHQTASSHSMINKQQPHIHQQTAHVIDQQTAHVVHQQTAKTAAT